MPPHTRRYDVAISYAGEDRRYANQLANALRQYDVSVFYDQSEKASLWGKNLYDDLTDIYRNQAQYCVLLLSQHYANKPYTKLERKAAQARALHQEDYILPVRLDNTDIPGMLPTIAYLQWPPETAETLATTLLLKLGKLPRALALLSRETLEEIRKIYLDTTLGGGDKTMFAALVAFKDLDRQREQHFSELDSLDRRTAARMELREQLRERGEYARMAELNEAAEVDSRQRQHLMQRIDELSSARQWFVDQQRATLDASDDFLRGLWKS